MPNPKEVAAIHAGGSIYSDWTTVSVMREHGQSWSQFTFTATEQSDITAKWQSVRLKPPDRVKINLGGTEVINGYIDRRQIAFNAHSHAVELHGKGEMTDIHKATAKLDGGELKNVTFEAVANKLLQPFGFSFRLENPGEDASRPFDRVSLQQGETVFQLLERYARMRGLWLSDNERGKELIGSQAHQPTGGGGGDLVEGRNIKSAVIVIDDHNANSDITVKVQGPPKDDNSFARPDTAAIQATKATGLINRYTPLVFQSPEPGRAQDAKVLVKMAEAYQVSNYIYATITVQGWFDDNGTIWNVGKAYQVYSPMALLDGQLWCKRVTWTQDNDNGTQTELYLCNWAAFTAGNLTIPSGSPGGGGDSLAGTSQGQDAVIDSESSTPSSGIAGHGQ